MQRDYDPVGHTLKNMVCNNPTFEQPLPSPEFILKLCVSQMAAIYQERQAGTRNMV